MSLAPFNKLPSRPEYIAKVLKMLEKHPDSRPIEIERKTGLTKTQVMCTLEQLLKDKKVKVMSVGPRRYSLANAD